YFTHAEFLHFATNGHGKLIHNKNKFRYFKVCYLAFAEFLQLLLAHLLTRVELHPRHNFFAKGFTWNTNHLHIRNRRVGKKKLFNFAWVNVLPATNNHIAIAAYNFYVALFIH